MANFQRLEPDLLALQHRILHGHGFHYAMSDDMAATLPRTSQNQSAPEERKGSYQGMPSGMSSSLRGSAL